ncbi:MAG: glutamine-hydrolyzing GMP synthase [archaeon]|nr:glutamine-hydrolyzing GMP synthase [archaeon]
MEPQDKIVILDFGSQYTHLLARRVRQLNVFSEILSPTAPSEELKAAKGIILSGGPESVYSDTAVAYNPELFSLGVPILGLCYGQQLIAHHLKGKVEPGKVKEYGTATLSILKGGLFKGVPKNFTVWMSHGDKVKKLPKGFAAFASTPDCEFAAIGDDEKGIYGLQFHPEVTHTQFGMKILENFVVKICGAMREWNMEQYLNQKIHEIREEAGDKNVFLLLSGGVDSTVCLALLDRALGSDRIHALHVDTGFMRKSESKIVKEELEKLGIREVNVIDASEKFFGALEGVFDPEEKRNIIGRLFVDIALEELNNMDFEIDTWLIGQGTIYPDTIETGGTAHAKKIKTHHNRAPIIMEMIEKGWVIEPLNQLYKDEVRELGRLLGLPQGLVDRHPFPGPGLAIRILCSEGVDETDEKLKKKVKGIALEEGYRAKLLPVKAVGVQGDNRTYSNAVLVEGELNYERLEAISTRITNSFSEVNRVVFLLEPQKVKKLELKKAYLTRERTAKLQEADAIAMRVLEQKGIGANVWQFPVVLMPVDFNGVGEGIVLRPVYSKEAMTAKFAKLGPSILEDMVAQIMKIDGIGAVMLDITHKPPATIEWE